MPPPFGWYARPRLWPSTRLEVRRSRDYAPYVTGGGPAAPRARVPGSARLLERLRDERGIALILALVIMAVLTITVTAVTEFTSSSSRNASESDASQKAHSLAEAGVNDAVSLISNI